jgi:hypothetical protein
MPLSPRIYNVPTMAPIWRPVVAMWTDADGDKCEQELADGTTFDEHVAHLANYPGMAPAGSKVSYYYGPVENGRLIAECYVPNLSYCAAHDMFLPCQWC